MAALLRGARAAERGAIAALLQRVGTAAAGAPADAAERAASGAACSTSGNSSSAPPPWGWQPARGFAKKGGGGGAAPKKPAAKAGGAAAVGGGEDFSRPTFRAAAPRRGDPIKELPESQRALLQELVPSGAKLRSPRQLGWDLGPKQTMALLHESLREAAGAPVLFTPFVINDIFQSAQTVAEWVKLVIESGEDFSSVERFFVQVLASEPRPDVRGLRVQIKGRISGKGGKASKKVWQTGATSVASLADPVDSAKAAAETPAGLIGIKVWIVYRRDAVGQGGFFDTRLKSPHTLAEVLAMPRAARAKASSSAWWAAPGPLQPAYVGAARPYKDGFDPLAAFGGGGSGGGGGSSSESSGDEAAV